MPLKLNSASAIKKHNISFQPPRPQFRIGENSPRVMVLDSSAQIVRQASIQTFRLNLALEN
jgi:hypothetical protein